MTVHISDAEIRGPSACRTVDYVYLLDTGKNEEGATANTSFSVESNFGVCVASLPALRPLFSRLTQLATRLRSQRPSSYEYRKTTENPYHSRRRSFGKIDSCSASDTDGVGLVPMNNIGVKTTTAISFTPQDGRGLEGVHPWEHA